MMLEGLFRESFFVGLVLKISGYAKKFCAKQVKGSAIIGFLWKK